MAAAPIFALALTAVGTAATAYGTYQQVQGAKKVDAANRQMIALQQKQDDLRQKQMELDATRRRRQTVREMLRARSMALATATAQNVSQGSVLPGAYGGISGQTGVNQLGISQNEEIGAGIFDLNRQISATGFARSSGQTQIATGAGISSLGGAIIQNLGPLTSAYKQFTTPASFGASPGAPLAINQYALR